MNKPKWKFGLWRLNEVDNQKIPMQTVKILIRYPLEIDGLLRAPLDSIKSLIEAWEETANG